MKLQSKITGIGIAILLLAYSCSKSKSHSYKDNPTYVEQTDYYSLFHGDHKIVMLGNSLTQRMHWDELLPDYDVVNRGIGSDITEGMLSRVANVIGCHPKIVFIESGVNDIANNIQYNDFIKCMSVLIDTLKSHQIKVVVVNVLHTTFTYPDAVNFNKSVNLFNKGLDSLTKQKSTETINLNKYLSRGNYLIPEYAEKDGIHLKAVGYIKWRKEVLEKLKGL